MDLQHAQEQYQKRTIKLAALRQEIIDSQKRYDKWLREYNESLAKDECFLYEQEGENMMDKLVDQLIKHEGERLKPYKCTAGKLTIGIGRNLDDKGITKSESRILLANDIDECEKDLKNIFGGQWNWISENRKVALLDMRFNLGPNRFRGFENMIAAVQEEDWQRAGDEAMDSLWAQQVQKDRSGRIFAQLVGG